MEQYDSTDVPDISRVIYMSTATSTNQHDL